MKEREIRPKNLHQKILALSKKDTAKFILPRKKELNKVACPGCGERKQKAAFKKFRMNYVVCPSCVSIYLSPRPSEKLIASLYDKMESVSFWESGFYKETAEARREKMFALRAAKVVETARKWLAGGDLKKPRLIDAGCGYGIFLEEIKKLGYFDEVMGIEPTPALAEATRKRGFGVVEEWITKKNVKLAPRANVLTCFEVLEHVYDPLKFLKTFSQLVTPGGLFILSFPCASGIDVQLLWDKSNTIYPPHHINILTVEGVKKLVERVPELEMVELATPGKLDVDIIKNARRDGVKIDVGRFMEYMFSRDDEKLLNDLQAFCSEHLLSSHLFLVLRKKTGAL